MTADLEPIAALAGMVGVVDHPTRQPERAALQILENGEITRRFSNNRWEPSWSATGHNQKYRLACQYVDCEYGVNFGNFAEIIA